MIKLKLFPSYSKINYEFGSTVLEERLIYFSILSIQTITKYHWKTQSKSVQSKKVIKISQRHVRQFSNKNNRFFSNLMFVVFVAF